MSTATRKLRAEHEARGRVNRTMPLVGVVGGITLLCYLMNWHLATFLVALIGGSAVLFSWAVAEFRAWDAGGPAGAERPGGGQSTSR